MLKGSRYLLSAALTMVVLGWLSENRIPPGHPIWWLAGLFGVSAVVVMVVGFYRKETW